MLVDVVFNDLEYFIFKFSSETEEDETLSMKTLVLKDSMLTPKSRQEGVNFLHSNRMSRYA